MNKPKEIEILSDETINLIQMEDREEKNLVLDDLNCWLKKQSLSIQKNYSFLL